MVCPHCGRSHSLESGSCSGPGQPVSALFGGPLQLAPGPEAGDGPPLRSPQAGPGATRVSFGIRAPRGDAGTDRFAPLPDQAVVPLLTDDRDRTLAAHPSAAEPSIDRLERLRPRPGPASQVTASDRILSPRNRSRIVIALGLLALLIVAGFAYSRLRKTRGQEAAASHREPCKVTLAIQPSEASVQIDHLPVMRDDLLLDQDASHVLHATAPGRIARRFSFKAKPGLELSVHLGRILPLPSSTDPEPSRAELVMSYPTNPASGEEISRAFAKLDRYAACLALLVHADGDARKGANRAAPSGGEIGRCIQLLQEAATLQPEMFQLHGAGAAYLQGVAGAQGSSAPHRLLATFRSDFFAAQTAWQMEELARQETDEGHMRRVALAAQAWWRQGKAPLALGRGSTDRRSKLDESHQAFLEFARHSPREMAQVSGADEFMKAAQDVVALARGQTGKRQDAAAALAACRQLFVAFNTLVVE